MTKNMYEKPDEKFKKNLSKGNKVKIYAPPGTNEIRIYNNKKGEIFKFIPKPRGDNARVDEWVVKFDNNKKEIFQRDELLKKL